jgi:hypothetical protein
MRAWAIAGLATLVTPAALPADAAPLPQAPSNSRQIPHGSYEDPFFGTQNGQICRRWCVEDRQPCDPVQFKIADGRCAYGRFWFGR